MSDENAVELWTMRLRRNASLAVEHPAGFPTARGFAHSLHSGTYQGFKKAREQPPSFNPGGEFSMPTTGEIWMHLDTRRMIGEELGVANVAREHRIALVPGLLADLPRAGTCLGGACDKARP